VNEKNAIKVHFIDVGQGDSILIQIPGTNPGVMLMDAGQASRGATVVSYLKSQNVKQIDWLVATHPDPDHIGGMAKVLDSLPVKKMYMPKTSHTTQTYQDFLLAVKRKGLTITEARHGVEVTKAEGPDVRLDVRFIGPRGTSYEQLNDWSAILRVEFGGTVFLFTGDGEAKSEFEMLLASDIQPRADVLKVPHHGSSDATSDFFLSAVSPRYAVISVGAGNPYGHPSQRVMTSLAKAKVIVYRTDQNGTVIIMSDGKNLSVSTSKKP
jgi:beta-lactamase superfamily II metal-dependent hydrolase